MLLMFYPRVLLDKSCTTDYHVTIPYKKFISFGKHVMI